METIEYTSSITPEYSIKVGKEVPRLRVVGIQPSEEGKPGEQFRQSQQAYEQGVQESETFGDDVEHCHSRSEGVSVRHMAGDKDSCWESRGGWQKSPFRRRKETSIFYLWMIFLA